VKINGNEIRPGYVIVHQGKLWWAVNTEHVKPGKGGAFMQVELKELKSGTKLNERFRANETVERAYIEEAPYQFLFRDGDKLTLMNPKNYDQIQVSVSLLGDGIAFLQDSMELTVSLYEGEVIQAKLPQTAVMEVTEADPVVKGQTAAASYKPATLENGVKIMVPPHITIGTRVVVNTEDRTYVERAKT
jgi:elongation factor P